jgi:membrane-associated protease RseP (regulator of RpoE activity)
VLVHRVAEDSPASDAGLESGDRITAIDGTSVNSAEELKAQLDTHSAGDQVTLTVVNAEGESEEVSVTLAERPEKSYSQGFGFDDFSEQFDRFLGSSFRYVDDEGNEVEIETVPGTITAISDTEITVDVNGDEGDRTFSIGEEAAVPEGLEAGNRVVVILENGELKAVSGGHFPLAPFVPGGFGGPIHGSLPRICQKVEGEDFPYIDRFCDEVAPEEAQPEPTPEA